MPPGPKRKLTDEILAYAARLRTKHSKGDSRIRWSNIRFLVRERFDISVTESGLVTAVLRDYPELRRHPKPMKPPDIVLRWLGDKDTWEDPGYEVTIGDERFEVGHFILNERTSEASLRKLLPHNVQVQGG